MYVAAHGIETGATRSCETSVRTEYTLERVAILKEYFEYVEIVVFCVPMF